ncbi:MAG TPA: hypothetical protein VK932_18415 [Kofleriaceae bacterium]|nr:hypothetical protein [Kofleriaceae bacterium]
MLETLVRHLDMVRLSASASLLALIGCTGLIDAPPPSKAETARQLWVDKALPALREATCEVCHGGASARPMVDFMIGAEELEIRQKLMEFDPAVISLDAPQSSRLLNKGQHEGPPLVGNLKSVVQEWIQAEKEAASDPGGGGGTLGLRTDDYTFALCTAGAPPDATCPVNEISLDSLGEGAGIPGAKIRFVAQGVGTGLYLNRLELVPGPEGAFIEHPLFVSIPADPKEKPIADTFDRFFNTKINLMTGATPVQIGGGTAAFVNFPPQNKLAIFFKAAKPFQPDGPGPGPVGGCKAPAAFEQVRTQFSASCTGAACHNTAGNNANSAVDMAGIGAPNAMNACNQIRLRVNLTDINQSGIFLATTPGNTNHPFTFGNNQTTFQNFRTAVTPWIIAERDAP